MISVYLLLDSCPLWHPAPWVFRYEFTEGVPSANGAGLAVSENARQPSAICAKSGIP